MRTLVPYLAGAALIVGLSITAGKAVTHAAITAANHMEYQQ